MTAPTVIGPRPVPVSGIDKELESIWKTLAPASLAEASPVMQASVVNLVAVADSRAGAEAVVEILTRLMGRAPGRFIVLESQPETDPPDIQASVSVMCEKAGERQICCEMIRLNAQGILADALPATAQAFYVPDLPVMVWWPASLEHPDLLRFAQSADRLVIDSRNFGLEGLNKLTGLIRESRKTRTAVGDLNWVRLTPYRQLFAQFFDSGDCRKYLEQVESVHLEATESATWLMTGWLLSRLRQLPKSLRRDQIVARTVGDEGLVFRVIEMKCKGGVFAVRRTDGETVEARAIAGSETVTRVARIPVAPVEKLLSDEISRAGRDRAYDAAVAAAMAA